MDYFTKYEANPAEELKWNISERRQGKIAIAGGNAQNFRTIIKVSEWLGENYNLESIKIVLPDALQGKIPPVSGLEFLASTDSGSISDGKKLKSIFEASDYNLIIGDLTKNSTTMQAILESCNGAKKPLIITRDSVDLLSDGIKESILINENLVFMASVAQLTKLFRAIYYPKMLAVSQSLMQVVEALHKFTLSYPVAIITLHNNQLITARSGKVAAIPLEKSSYSSVTVWSGELAAKIAVYNLYNPNNFIPATICACFE